PAKSRARAPSAMSTRRWPPRSSTASCAAEAGVGDYSSECTFSNLPVVGAQRHEHTCRRGAGSCGCPLATEHKAGALQRGADLATGQIGGELGHVPATIPHSLSPSRALRGFHVDELLAGLGRD